MGVYNGNSIYNDSIVTVEKVEEIAQSVAETVAEEIADEKISENGKGVFCATFGTTSYDELVEAYEAGKIICVNYSYRNYTVTIPLGWKSSVGHEPFYFLCDDKTSSNSSIQLSIDDLNTWSYNYINSVDSALDSVSENPVQNKVIYAAIGDVESLLAAL